MLRGGEHRIASRDDSQNSLLLIFGYSLPKACREGTPVFFVKPYMLRYNRAADNREMIEVVVLEWVFNRLA